MDTYELHKITGPVRTSIEILGYDSLADLRKRNKKLYNNLRNKAIRHYYERVKSRTTILPLQPVRNILARAFGLSIHRVEMILYYKGDLQGERRSDD